MRFRFLSALLLFGLGTGLGSSLSHAGCGENVTESLYAINTKLESGAKIRPTREQMIQSHQKMSGQTRAKAEEDIDSLLADHRRLLDAKSQSAHESASEQKVTPEEALEILHLDVHASETEVNEAFRLRSKINHPDRDPGNPYADQNFRVLTRAKEVALENAPKVRTVPKRSGTNTGASAVTEAGVQVPASELRQALEQIVSASPSKVYGAQVEAAVAATGRGDFSKVKTAINAIRSEGGWSVNSKDKLAALGELWMRISGTNDQYTLSNLRGAFSHFVKSDYEEAGLLELYHEVMAMPGPKKPGTR